jgi:hypothetical protein
VLKICGDFTELFEGGFEVFDDFLAEKIGIGEVVGFFECFVSGPENVEARKDLRPFYPTSVFVLRRAGRLHGVSNC